MRLALDNGDRVVLRSRLEQRVASATHEAARVCRESVGRQLSGAEEYELDLALRELDTARAALELLDADPTKEIS